MRGPTSKGKGEGRGREGRGGRGGKGEGRGGKGEKGEGIRPPKPTVWIRPCFSLPFPAPFLPFPPVASQPIDEGGQCPGARRF